MVSTTEALSVAAIALLVIYVSRMLFKQRKVNLPPGPTPWPMIGSFHVLGTHPHKSLADLAGKYGPVMSIRLGQKLCVVATSPAAAKEFLKHQDANFSSRPPLRCPDVLASHDIVFHDLTPLVGHLKKILVSELTSTKRLEATKFIRAEEVAHMLRAISKETGPIRVKRYLLTMSTNIVSRMIFNKRFSGAADDQNAGSDILECMEIVEESNPCFGAVHPQDFFNCIPKWFDPQGLETRFRKLKARMDLLDTKLINEHKEERRKNPISEGDKTMLDVLLEQLDYPEHGVTEEHIKGVLWDSVIAGTDTTTVTSEWAMAEVLRNPSVLKEARSELDRVVGPNRTVQESDIPELKYIKAIVKEAIRLHATVPLLIPHQSINATKVFGYDIPAKTRLFVNVWAIGRDSEIWEKPLQFVPERFLDGARHAKTEYQGQHFELIPFGAGRRICPGLAFASIAMHLEVANLLHAFDWSFPGGMAPEKLDMSEGQGLILWMRNPLVAVAKPRLPSHLY